MKYVILSRMDNGDKMNWNWPFNVLIERQSKVKSLFEAISERLLIYILKRENGNRGNISMMFYTREYSSFTSQNLEYKWENALTTRGLSNWKCSTFSCCVLFNELCKMTINSNQTINVKRKKYRTSFTCHERTALSFC